VTILRTGFAAAGAAALLLVTTAAPGGAATLPGTGIRRNVTELVRSTYPDLPIGNVACPDRVAKRSGTTFHCTVQLPGAFLVVDGTVGTGSAVTLAAAHAVLPKAQLEQFVAANASLPATVDCGSAPFRVARPGQVLSCRAALADGTARTVGVTVADTAGNVTISSVD
jgi:hypothetical protein